jgi:hypothetical protein
LFKIEKLWEILLKNYSLKLVIGLIPILTKLLFKKILKVLSKSEKYSISKVSSKE